eukprot:Hpha_TRINITY_DN16802_c1_g3::TRINITY_DN16802_c1_g3_i2::g.151068::m.151068
MAAQTWRSDLENVTSEEEEEDQFHGWWRWPAKTWQRFKWEQYKAKLLVDLSTGDARIRSHIESQASLEFERLEQARNWCARSLAMDAKVKEAKNVFWAFCEAQSRVKLFLKAAPEEEEE